MFSKTQISDVTDHKYPKMIFAFKTFDVIKQIENVNGETLFDIIGVIVDPDKVITQSSSRLIEIKIADLQPTSFRGEIRASSYFNASRVYINHNMEEFTDFQERISGDDLFACQQAIVPVSSSAFSDEFAALEVKSIEDVQQLEEGSYWILGRIDTVECHYGAWYYMACKGCLKKVTKVENMFTCGHCRKPDQFSLPRHRFVVNVVNDSDNASLLLVQLENDFASSNNYPYTVNKICNIPHVVEKYIPPGFEGSNSDLAVTHTLPGSDTGENVVPDFVLPSSSSLPKDTPSTHIAERPTKRCLSLEFIGETVGIVEKEKSNKRLVIKQEKD
ncbi:hypothetical protein AAHA92_15660 [Salvia divinorum]|uniref:Replication factor A C-terminal domain-containing protein n=1 Tax=Salvia divinorum TaxID=28513 RepID=A0ABD1HIS5_SALDI